MRPAGEAARIRLENPMLASGAGAMAAGGGNCADARPAQTSRQNILVQAIFIARQRAGSRIGALNPSSLSIELGVGAPDGRMEAPGRKENPVKALIGMPDKTWVRHVGWILYGCKA